MAAWKKDDVKRLFSDWDYRRGLRYYQEGRVRGLDVRTDGEVTSLKCKVRGTRDYDVRALALGTDMQVVCTCPKFAKDRECKHVVAALLAGASDGGGGKPMTDLAGNALLDAYRRRFEGHRPPTAEAELIPVLEARGYGNEYPSVGLKVGKLGGRPYVVRNVSNFLDLVEDSEDHAYGKLLTLNHNIHNFTPESQALISILMDAFPNHRSYSTMDFGWSSYYSGGSDKQYVKLTGHAFDRFFDLMRGKALDAHFYDDTRPVLLQDGAPQVSLEVSRKEHGADMAIKLKGSWSFFGNSRTLYALGTKDLYQVGEDFRRDVYPLIGDTNGRMFISDADMPAFCGFVVPAIQGEVTIEDPEAVLEEFAPSEGTAQFYFDLDDGQLVMRLAYKYGDQEIAPNLAPSATPGIKRDLRSEKEVMALADRWLDNLGEGAANGRPTGKEQYVLKEHTDLISFLVDDLDTFNEYGDVYVSDALKRLRIRPEKASVGVSVTNGMLSLNIETGEFPPEELEALYDSLLKKKKYHKLPDGRFVTLDGSSLEPLAEMAHMLRIPSKEMRKGEVHVPAFRAPYVADLLEHSGNVEFQRDKEFRALVRNFKTVRESDFQVPDTFQGKLRGYQRTGFQWLKTLEQYGFGGILADEMGLGKTAEMIAYLSTVPNKRVGAPNLVVCPASLILNWGDELAKFAPELKGVLIMGTVAERQKLREESKDADVWVTSYELLRQDAKSYHGQDFYTCILDEAQHVKNSQTLLSKAVKEINCQRRFVMTGTPIENRLSEMWNLFDFLMPGYLYTHGVFLQKLEKPIIKSENKEATEQLKRLVRPFLLRRLKKEVLKELPPKIDHVRRVALTSEERKVYLAEAHDAKETIMSAGSKGSRFRALAALTRLREICCAPQLVFENYHGADSKLDACMDLVEGMVENGHQILLFSQFTSMLDIIRERLDKAGITSFTLQGSTTKKKRAELVKAFNNGEASVFLISLKAGGTGLNLTAADVVIHYDPWWNQAAQDQATDRAHRIGQASTVQVYKLIAEDTVEEKILQLQETKAGLLDMVSEEGGEGILQMSEEDMLALLD